MPKSEILGPASFWRTSLLSLPPVGKDDEGKVCICWGGTISEAAQGYQEVKEELQRLLEESNGGNGIKNNG